MITLRQLEFALSVAKHRHFKRAAEACNISQSALSLGIAELEKQLDTQVFERNNKQVLITPIGKEILERAQRIFSDINDLTALAHNHQTPLTYPMIIGIIPTVAPYLLPKVLPSLQKDFPNFSINVVEQQTERLAEQVRYGHIDTAIIALPYPLEGLHTFEFWQEDFVALIPKKYDNLTALGNKITGNELSKSNLLLLSEGHCLTDQALTVCSLSKHEVNSSFSDASLNTLIQMALTGMGATLVPEIALAQINQESVNIMHLDEKGPHRRLAFISRLNYARVNDIKRLSQIFGKALQEHKAKSLATN